MHIRLPLFFYLLLIATPAIAEDIIQIHDPWINEAPPTINVNAGYMQIKNNSAEIIELVNVKSDMFERIEFHVTNVDNGIAKMQKKDTISIPAQSIFKFSPGGFHLMMFNNKGPIRAGNYIPIVLTFSNQISYQVNAEVKSMHSTEHQHHN